MAGLWGTDDSSTRLRQREGDKIFLKMNRGCGRASFIMENRGEEGLMMRVPDPNDPTQFKMIPAACYSCPDAEKGDPKACYSMVISQRHGRDVTGGNIKSGEPEVLEQDYEMLLGTPGGIRNVDENQLAELRGDLDDVGWSKKFRSLLLMDQVIQEAKAPLEAGGMVDEKRLRTARNLVTEGHGSDSYKGMMPALVAVRLSNRWGRGMSPAAEHKAPLDGRSGINSDGSAWCHPYSLLGIARAGINTWTCISSC